MQVDNEDLPVIQKVKQIIQTEMSSRTKGKELALMACVLNPFTKGLEFLSPSEKELANKLRLENAQNVSLGECIVKNQKRTVRVPLHSKRNPLYLCLLIQINQMPPLLSSLTTLMSLVSQPHLRKHHQLTWMTGCKILCAWGRV